MPAIHIREVDDAVLDALKARAAANHRSLQGEVSAILEEAVRGNPGPSRRRRLELKTVRVGGPARYSREVIYDDEAR